MSRRLGVLGWPAGHSLSPRMQNAALAALGLEGWRYQHLPVPPPLLAETVRALPGAGFVGANATIPHKEAVLALADQASPAAREIGAANTLIFDDGALRVDNTDAPGLIAALPGPVAGRRALVLGAGGTGRAAVWALREAGAAAVAVWNRTPERARALADDLGAEAVERPRAADLLVNCTAVGLSDPAETFKELPLDADDLGDFPVVVDFVYREGGTTLTAEAEARGSAVVDGLEILVRQGAVSLKLWTGHDAPLAVMRTAVRT